VVAAVLYDKGTVFIFRRNPSQSGAGAWEFPGGKIEPGETPEAALKREIREELGVEIEVEDKVGENVHQYPAKKIHLHFYWAKVPKQAFKLSDHDAYQAVRPEDLPLSLLSEADRPLVDVLKKHPRLKV